MNRALSLALLAFVLPLAASGGTATLVRDINTTHDEYFDLEGPRSFMVVGNRIVFASSEPSTGLELWATDGTSTGTRLLEDICPGSCSSVIFPLGVANGAALLLAKGGIENDDWRLWRSDGTEAGTYILDLPFPLHDPWNGTRPVLVEGVLYLPACTDERGCELWRSDGTEAGTRAEKQIDPGDSYVEFSQPVVAGKRFYFRVTTIHGVTLWVSDGTAAGTNPVTTINNGSYLSSMTGTSDGRVFFTAWIDGEGEELWVSDGIPAGTRSLTQFEADNPFNSTQWMKAFGSRVYFVANDVHHGAEIWRSDGTVKGTQRVTDFGFYEPFDESYDGTLLFRLEEVGGRIVFEATDGVTDARLWVSDGRPESTAPLDCGGCDLSGNLVSAGGKVFFVATDTRNDTELWITDGTKAGTRIPRDLCQAKPCSVSMIEGMDQGGVLFSVADNFSHELWYSNGTAAGTRPITGMPGLGGPSRGFAWTGNRLYHGGSDGLGGADLWVSENGESRPVADLARKAPSARPEHLAPLGDRLLFTACDGENRQTWISSGTTESTVPLPGHPASHCSNSSPYPALNQPVSAGGRLFYIWNERLWATDGTHGGAVQLTQTHPSFPVAFQGKLFFHTENGEIWKSDGTPQGTVKAFEIPGSSSVFTLKAVGSELYLTAASTELAVWRSDGTQAGTRKLTSGLNAQYQTPFTRAGSFVFFLMEPAFAEIELWKTDGTPAGTVRVHAFGNSFEVPRELTEHQGKLYFFALADGSGWNLWRSDGTDAGTVPLRHVIETQYSSSPAAFQLNAFAGRLVFVAGDSEHGDEIWTSDGTAAGTALLLDIFPGAASSSPSGLTVAGGRLYFAANDGERGRELWSSDGTAAGTRLEHDLAPEDLSSDPGSLTVTDTHLYFVADDGLAGRELWSLPLAGGGCQPSPRHLCVGNNRYRVEAAWRDFQGNTGRGTAVSLTPDTGYFWFFGPANIEVMVKVLDGTGLNGHRWVFYGALSSVEYTITVTDTQTGLTRRYFNPMGQLASVGDTTGFGPLGAFSKAPAVAEPAPAVLAEERTVAATGTCLPTVERLCLGDLRFAVEVAWKDFQGNEGTGKAFGLTPETGYFWFFDAANVELMIKILDGTSLNGKHWVFYGALSSVEYTITVTDTQTGAQKIYKNPSGTLASVADTGAF